MSKDCITYFPPSEAKSLSITPVEASMESSGDRSFSWSGCNWDDVNHLRHHYKTTPSWTQTLMAKHLINFNNDLILI